MKILTVVVPIYNTELYINRCLRSLTYDENILKDIEIIAVNDGSKDTSIDIAKQYQKEYPESIVIIDKENGGHGSTINAGLKVAKGKYFRVVDSDDWVNIIDFPKYIEKIKNIDVDAIITDYTRELIYNCTTEKFEYSKQIERNKAYTFDNFDQKLLGDDYFFMATTAFRTDALRAAGLVLDEKMFYVDMEYVILPIQKICSFIFLDFDIYRYFIGRNDQSINAASMFRNRTQHEKVLRRLIEFYNTTKFSASQKKYIKKILVLMINTNYFIYSSGSVEKRSHVKEVRTFDTYLKSASPELYSAVAIKFPYIKHYRKTSFLFTKTANSIFKKYVNWKNFRDKASGMEEIE